MALNLIQKLEEYFNERFNERKEYAKGLSLAVITAISCNSFKTDITCPIQCKTNVYLCLCGQSNTGKTSMIHYFTDLLDGVNYRNRLGADVTPEYLPVYLSQNSYAFMRIVELSSLLGSYKTKRYMVGLREILINAFDGTTLSQGRSTRATIEAKNYSLSALGDIQPETLSKTADEVDIQSGFLPRFLWYVEDNPKQIPPMVATDYVLQLRDDIIRDLKTVFTYSHKNEIHFVFKQFHVNQIYERLTPMLKTDIFAFKPFYDRMVMFTYKLAMLYFIGSPQFIEMMNSVEEDSGPASWPVGGAGSEILGKKEHKVDITNEAVSWAIEYSQKYVESNLSNILKIINLSDADKIVDEVRRHDGSIPRSVLYRSVIHQMKDGPRIHRAIELAQAMGYIKPERRQGGTSYVLIKDGEEAPDVYAYDSDKKEKKDDIKEEDEPE
jgi:GTPase SAR1 family protein